jgi:hypothetical protein
VLRDGGGGHGGPQDWLVVTVDGLLLLDDPELDVLLELSSDDVV